MTDLAVANPFTSEQSRQQLKPSTASTDVAVQRELAEVQAAVLMARRFPRDPVRAMDAILTACTRSTLAQSALYQYARGGTDITGPSIRLAEAMAQSWGNLTFGIRELEQRPGESTMEAYAWDMESNVRQARVFQVRHERHTRAGSHRLTDPRDIYEANANQGARRLRACILGVIPGDVVEAAVQQCEATLVAEADTSPESIKKMIDSFAQFGVTKEQIEARCQRRADAIRPAQIVQLRKIWSSLNDGMSQAADWFQTAPQAEPPQTGNQALRSKLAPKAQPQPPAEEEEPHPEQAPPDRSREATPQTPTPPEGAPEGEIDEAESIKEDEPTEYEIERQQDAETLPHVEAIKPQRLVGRRTGWDWPKFADDVLAVARSLRAEQWVEFRARNASMIDTLRVSDKDLWSRVQQGLADAERSHRIDPP
jgi:hypothetical protein